MRILALGLISVVVAAPWLAGAALQKPPKVRVSPLGIRLAPLPADEVLITVSIPQGSPYWCPELEVVWAEGNTSTRQPDCEPFDEGPVSFSMRGPAGFAYGATANIQVTLRQPPAKPWVRVVQVQVQ